MCFSSLKHIVLGGKGMLDIGSGRYPVISYHQDDPGDIRAVLAPIAWGELGKNGYTKRRESLLRGLKRTPGGDLLANLLDTPEKITKWAKAPYVRLPGSVQKRLESLVTLEGDFPDSAFFVSVVVTPSES